MVAKKGEKLVTNLVGEKITILKPRGDNKLGIPEKYQGLVGEVRAVYQGEGELSFLISCRNGELFTAAKIQFRVGEIGIFGSGGWAIGDQPRTCPTCKEEIKAGEQIGTRHEKGWVLYHLDCCPSK